MAEHTPGPWIYYNARATQNGAPVYTLASIAQNPASVHDGIWLADIRQGRKDDAIDLAQGSANARLISAAPDLLAACRGLLHEMERVRRLPDSDPDAWMKLCDAIGKAQGVS